MHFGGAARGKDCFLHSFMLKTRHEALSAPSGCASQDLAGAIFTLRVTPPTTPRPTHFAVTAPIVRGKFPRKWHHQQFSWRQLASIADKGLIINLVIPPCRSASCILLCVLVLNLFSSVLLCFNLVLCINDDWVSVQQFRHGVVSRMCHGVLYLVC